MLNKDQIWIWIKIHNTIVVTELVLLVKVLVVVVIAAFILKRKCVIMCLKYKINIFSL